MEIVFNIWFLVDIESKYSKYIFLKPYCLGGTDDDKFKILSQLAETDYQTSDRIDIEEEMETDSDIVNSYGVHQDNIDQFIDENLSFLTDRLNQFLYAVRIDYEESLNFNASLPKSPLFVCTLLMSNSKGEMRPFTTEENRAWCFRQYKHEQPITEKADGSSK